MQNILTNLLEGPTCIASVAYQEFCQQGLQRILIITTALASKTLVLEMNCC